MVKKQAQREDCSIDELTKIFHESAEDIMKRIPDKTYWPIYSSTGLRSKSCELIRKYIQQNSEKIKSLFLTAGYKDLSSLIQIVLEMSSSIPEMQITQTFSGNYSELLEWWLNGTTINDIMKEFSAQSRSSGELSKLIENYFSYRLPWGISALIRIAVKELDLKKENISDFVTFFPTMVKFGVPLPAATWAFSLGIPFRKSAIDLAMKYLEEVEKPNFEDYRKWINNFDQEDLRSRFGFVGDVLEDISQALSISTSNDLLKEYSSCEEILPYETNVRGIKYEDRKIVALGARNTQLVDLVRDYDNVLDHNAIKILLDGKDLGYVKRDLAQVLAPDIDCGLKLSGKIVIIKRGDIPQIRIRIAIEDEV